MRDRNLLRIGGVAFILVGVSYTICVVLTRFVPAHTGSVGEYLLATNSRFGAVVLLWATYMVSDVLLIPALIALFVALDRNHPLLWIGAGIVGAYIVFDLGFTEPNWLALASLARGYATGSAADQQSYLGAAQYGLAMVPFVNLLSFAVSGLGFLLISVVMLRSRFRRSTAIFGVAVMALSMAAGIGWFVPVLQILIVPVLSAFALWCVVVGGQLIRLAGRSGAEAQLPEELNQSGPSRYPMRRGVRAT